MNQARILASACLAAAVLLLSFGAQAQQNMEWEEAFGAPRGSVFTTGVDANEGGGFGCVTGMIVAGNANFGADPSGVVQSRDAINGPTAFVGLFGTHPSTGLRQVQWVYLISPGISANQTGEVDIDAVALNGTTPSNARCVVTGSFDGRILFDDAPSHAGTTAVDSVLGRDGFVSSFGGHHREWTRLLVAVGDVETYDIEFETGRYVVGGAWENVGGALLVVDEEPSTSIGPDALFVGGDGGREGFVVSYDWAGTPVWGRRLGGLADDEVLGVDGDWGSIYVAGSYQDKLLVDATWGTQTFDSPTDPGRSVAYVLRLQSSDGLLDDPNDIYERWDDDEMLSYRGVYVDEGMMVACGDTAAPADAGGFYDVFRFPQVDIPVFAGQSSGGVNACYIDSNDDGVIHGLALGGDFVSPNPLGGVLRRAQVEYLNVHGTWSVHRQNKPSTTIFPTVHEVLDLDFGTNGFLYHGRWPSENRAGWAVGTVSDGRYTTDGVVDLTATSSPIFMMLGYE